MTVSKEVRALIENFDFGFEFSIPDVMDIYIKKHDMIGEKIVRRSIYTAIRLMTDSKSIKKNKEGKFIRIDNGDEKKNKM